MTSVLGGRATPVRLAQIQSSSTNCTLSFSFLLMFSGYVNCSLSSKLVDVKEVIFQLKPNFSNSRSSSRFLMSFLSTFSLLKLPFTSISSEITSILICFSSIYYSGRTIYSLNLKPITPFPFIQYTQTSGGSTLNSFGGLYSS